LFETEIYNLDYCKEEFIQNVKVKWWRADAHLVDSKAWYQFKDLLVGCKNKYDLVDNMTQFGSHMINSATLSMLEKC
jgi:hypothetical protein